MSLQPHAGMVQSPQCSNASIPCNASAICKQTPSALVMIHGVRRNKCKWVQAVADVAEAPLGDNKPNFPTPDVNPSNNQDVFKQLGDKVHAVSSPLPWQKQVVFSAQLCLGEYCDYCVTVVLRLA